MKTYDAIVIGAGAIGSAAAYYLAKDGLNTLLIEQFALDHQMGSSYGHSRIIRYAYDHPAYIALAKGVYPLWEDLQAAYGEPLLIKTGGIDFGRTDEPRYMATKQALTDMQIPFEQLSREMLKARFPQFVLADDMDAIYQADAGLLKASKCVLAHVELGQQTGNLQFLPETPVLDIQLDDNLATIKTQNETFQAPHIVVTAGAWAKHLLAQTGLDLPLEVSREQLVFFQTPDGNKYGAENIPVSIGWGDEIFYTIPEIGGHGFKGARHFSFDYADPDTVNRTPDAAYAEAVRGHMARHLPEIAKQPIVEQRVCLYTMTPDEHFVMDCHPDYPFVAIGAGFSGHGFKFSTLIGQILGKLSRDEDVAYDLSLFKATRF